MGLDNIPMTYPCRHEGTAVLRPSLDSDGKPRTDETGEAMMLIDCDATKKANGCPYKRDLPAGLIGTIGMFGTECWYRGKYGNYLLEAADLYDEVDGTSFYGDDQEGTFKSPQSCLDLANTIDERLADRRWLVGEDGSSIRDDLKYAAWWLRWVARYDGSACWY